jgi:CRP-like cAMP-binding protein
MTTKVTRERMITFLLETPMFENLEPAEIRELMPIIRAVEYPAGAVLFEEGEPGDAWYALYRGKVDVIKNVGEGQQEIYPLDTGACFGEIALLDGGARTATIKAIDDSIVLRMSRPAFEDLLNENHSVANKLLWHLAVMLAQRARSTTERLSELMLESQRAQEKRPALSKVPG